MEAVALATALAPSPTRPGWLLRLDLRDSRRKMMPPPTLLTGTIVAAAWMAAGLAMLAEGMSTGEKLGGIARARLELTGGSSACCGVALLGSGTLRPLLSDDRALRPPSAPAMTSCRLSEYPLDDDSLEEYDDSLALSSASLPVSELPCCRPSAT